jgi:hypothetical protein
MEKDWGPALRAHDRLRDPTIARHMSAKAVNQGRAREKSNLQQADARRNAHVRSCAACQAEGLEPDFDSTASHHF